MITMTDRARAQVRKLIEANDLGDVALRIGVQGGGCSGYNFDLSFEAGPQSGDKVYDCGDVKVLVAKLVRPFVGNVLIDYEETSYGAGFIFSDGAAAKAGFE